MIRLSKWLQEDIANGEVREPSLLGRAWLAARLVPLVADYRRALARSSFRALLRRARDPGGSSPALRLEGHSVASLAAAVCWAARALPGRTTCLARALAATHVLRRAGFAAELRVGVGREAERVVAHAWVEVDEAVVLGRTAIPYLPLAELSDDQPARCPE